MGLISRRFRFLQNLFPPGGALPPQPGFFEESISPVHQVLNGTDRLAEWFAFNAFAAAGVLNLSSGAAPEDKYWYVFACQGSHDDPVARNVWVNLVDDAGNVHTLAAGPRAQPTDVPVAVPRSFIIPPRCHMRLLVDALAGANFIHLSFLYLELDLGEPAPPSP